jgi:hypothetical protein
MVVSRLRPPPPSGAERQIDQRRKVERNGTVYEQAVGGINADRRRPEPDLLPELPDGFPLRDDPRQVDIEDMLHARGDPPAVSSFVYDADAARFRGHLCELVETLTSPRWRSVEDAIDAWPNFDSPIGRFLASL